MRKIDYSEFFNCEEKYLEYVNPSNFQNRWEKLRTEIIRRHPECANIYPEKVRDIFTADFDSLNEIYLCSNKLSVDEKAAAKRIFNYDYDNSKLPTIPKSSTLSTIRKSEKQNSNIAEFFIENADKLHISACYYCEMNYVFPYIAEQYSGSKKKNIKIQKRMFDLDHFFEKKDSPITALSLYNFIPSCQVCNSRIKGKRDMIDIYHIDGYPNISNFSELSPSSKDYSFDENVKIQINPKNGVGFISDIEKNQIDFECSKIVYKRDISAFQLVERYNYPLIKKKALQLKELKLKLPESRVESIVQFFNDLGVMITKEDVRFTIFHEDEELDKYSIFAKLKRDILSN